MQGTGLIVPYRNSKLFAVPAMHFNHIFALEVYRLCADPATRPEAIAVELGPHTAFAIEAWLKELFNVKQARRDIPVMLGLLKRNYLIRASLKDKALALQKEMGRDLSELSPQLLKRELGFSAYSLSCLSPVDSIIEAIRCGIELDIPVFGIDLEDVADSAFRPVVVEDPLAAENLAAYVAKNVRFAEDQRDEEVDNRREIAMTARLKTMLGNSNRILFTCGMAHWLRIQRYLNDCTVRPAVMPELSKGLLKKFKRVVIHPVMALQCMDLFPSVVERYQRTRRPLTGPSNSLIKSGKPDMARLLRNRLTSAYRDYFNGRKNGDQMPERGQELYSLDGFEGYLGNFCTLNQRRIPDMFMTLVAGQEIMGSEFTASLSKSFMKFPWARPGDFPDCDVLFPPENSSEISGGAKLMDNNETGEEDIVVEHLHAERKSPEGLKISYEWRTRRELKRSYLFGSYNHTWLPWDRLVTSMSIRAMKMAVRKKNSTKAVAFEGSLLEGIDTKSTLRSFSRGQENFFVRDSAMGMEDDLNPSLGFPIVWILEAGECPESEWTELYVPDSFIEKHIRDRESFRHFVQKNGCNMISIIAYARKDYDMDGAGSRGSVKVDRYDGMLAFQPLAMTNLQYARWAELTRFKRSPFCSWGTTSFSKLESYYETRHGIRIGDLRWSTVLMLLALPYAKNKLTVVVPDGYRIDEVVFRTARKFSVEVNAVPLGLFPDPQVKRLAFCHLVPAITLEPEYLYPESAEKAIGELQTDNRHLVPRSVLDFGRYG